MDKRRGFGIVLLFFGTTYLLYTAILPALPGFFAPVSDYLDAIAAVLFAAGCARTVGHRHN